MNNRRVANLLLGIAFVIAFWLIWSRLRIVVFVNLPWYVLLGLTIGLALAIFLVLDHLVNRSQ
jgi:hypothetical protein